MQLAIAMLVAYIPLFVFFVYEYRREQKENNNPRTVIKKR